MDNKLAFGIIEKYLINSSTRSQGLRELTQEDWFHNYPFIILAKLKYTEQSPVHHPEGNVWNHTLLVVDEAAKRKAYSTDQRVFMWAALLHDIGKPASTRLRKGRITAYNHDKIGAKLSKDFLEACTDEKDFIEKVSLLVYYHMQILYVLKELPFGDIAGMRRQVSVSDAALLGFCDRLGRTGADIPDEINNTLLFLKKCNERTDYPWLRMT